MVEGKFDLIVSEQCPAKLFNLNGLTMLLVCTCVREDHSKTRVSPFYSIHDPGACEYIYIVVEVDFFCLGPDAMSYTIPV